MKKIVVTADDFGWTKGVNEGIVRSVKEGIVTDIAMMVLTDHENCKHAVSLIEKNKLSHIGLHTCLFPWTKNFRPRRSDYIEFFKMATDGQIEEKVMKEIEVFEKLIGKKPDFISPQFNMHGNLRLLKTVAKYAVENDIPVRIPRAVLVGDEITDKNYSAEIFLKRLGIKMTDHLLAHILGSSVTKITGMFESELTEIKEGESVELLLHPGYHDREIFEDSSLNYERTRDLVISLDPVFKDKILKMGFIFGHMSEI